LRFSLTLDFLKALVWPAAVLLLFGGTAPILRRLLELKFGKPQVEVGDEEGRVDAAFSLNQAFEYLE